MSTARDRYLRALDRVDDVVAGIRPAQWGLATPCPDWDVRELLGHLADGQAQVTAMLRGAPPRPGTAGPADPDPAAAWRRARQEVAAALAAVTDDAVLRTPLGELPLPALLDTAVIEPLLHGWDLATAVGGATDLDPETAEVTLRGVRALGEQLAQTGMYAAALPTDEGSTAQERLLALTGRRPVGP
ncbi:TIGR03086 family metal-binding protein [Geodermatophilus maliterrae]|uniref:TIGR03086 family metal-binding protein n=1 Tax=Geodermatophilus maliterrae TaxID=3162531 RepID=A0ABV3XFV7_9ACTN